MAFKLTGNEVDVEHPHALLLPGRSVVTSHPHRSPQIDEVDYILCTDGESHVGEQSVLGRLQSETVLSTACGRVR
jgi:hypothetical protein